MASRSGHVCGRQHSQFCLFWWVMLHLKVLPASRQVLQQQMVPAAFAAQSLLAALGSVQFVSNVFFAYFVLHEKVSIDLSTAACHHLCAE